MSEADEGRCAIVIADVVEVVRSSQRLPDDEPLAAGTSLLDRGLALDSVALLDLVLALEERFSIRFSDQEVTPAHFQSIASVARLIDRIRTGGPRADA